MDLTIARFKRGHGIQDTTSMLVYESIMWRRLDVMDLRVEQDKSLL